MAEDNNNFYTLVYHIAAQIPEGKVLTYGIIAKLAGRPACARLVGYAMKNIPEGMDIPAHRVVNSMGKLAPEYVFGSKSLQRIMLEAEGITFKADGSIHMIKHLWQEQFK